MTSIRRLQMGYTRLKKIQRVAVKAPASHRIGDDTIKYIFGFLSYEVDHRTGLVWPPLELNKRWRDYFQSAQYGQVVTIDMRGSIDYYIIVPIDAMDEDSKQQNLTRSWLMGRPLVWLANKRLVIQAWITNVSKVFDAIYTQLRQLGCIYANVPDQIEDKHTPIINILYSFQSTGRVVEEKLIQRSPPSHVQIQLTECVTAVTTTANYTLTKCQWPETSSHSVLEQPAKPCDTPTYLHLEDGCTAKYCPKEARCGAHGKRLYIMPCDVCHQDFHGMCMIGTNIDCTRHEFPGGPSNKGKITKLCRPCFASIVFCHRCHQCLCDNKGDLCSVCNDHCCDNCIHTRVPVVVCDRCVE